MRRPLTPFANCPLGFTTDLDPVVASQTQNIHVEGIPGEERRLSAILTRRCAQGKEKSRDIVGAIWI